MVKFIHANNWSAKSRDQLIRKIQKCVKEFDMAPILKMFDHLKAKNIDNPKVY